VQGAWQIWLQEEALSNNLKGLPKVNAQPRFWYNEELKSRNFLIPGSLAIIMALIGTLLTALVISREWERGTMEALMSTPVNIYELVLGKMIPYYILGMISMTVCVFISVFLYDVPFRGSFIVLGLVASVFLYPAFADPYIYLCATSSLFCLFPTNSIFSRGCLALVDLQPASDVGHGFNLNWSNFA
jgi:ABC-2 type transport system permease protein